MSWFLHSQQTESQPDLLFWLLLKCIRGIMQRSAFLTTLPWVKLLKCIRNRMKRKLKKPHLIYCRLVDIILCCDLLQRAGCKQCAEQFNKYPTLCIKDLTRWLIAIARGTLNPVIVFQSCCPVIYSCCSASVSVLEYLMPYSPSQSCSVIRAWLPECDHSCTVCVRERKRGTGQTGRGKVRETGIDRWMDRWAQWKA